MLFFCAKLISSLKIYAQIKIKVLRNKMFFVIIRLSNIKINGIFGAKTDE